VPEMVDADRTEGSRLLTGLTGLADSLAQAVRERNQDDGIRYQQSATDYTNTPPDTPWQRSKDYISSLVSRETFDNLIGQIHRSEAYARLHQWNRQRQRCLSGRNTLARADVGGEALTVGDREIMPQLKRIDLPKAVVRDPGSGAYPCKNASSSLALRRQGEDSQQSGRGKQSWRNTGSLASSIGHTCFQDNGKRFRGSDRVAGWRREADHCRDPCQQSW
jgi:hypothetical protein